MAFLFKSKKNQNNAQAQQRPDTSSGIPVSQSSPQSASGTGSRGEKGAVQQNPTPASSVNNSLNSLGGGGGRGANTPSPEQQNPRRGPGPEPEQSNDLPVSQNVAVYFEFRFIL